MTVRRFTRAAALGLLVGAAGLGGCASSGSSGSSGSGGGFGQTFSNLLFYNQTTVPQVQPSGPEVFAVQDCPAVDVSDGGAAIRMGGVQISVADVARECTGHRDGSTTVKVGIRGRALEGPGGRGGRFDVPVFVRVKRGERVFASRTRRASVNIAANEFGGDFTVVESGLVVPAGVGEGQFEIEVGLGSPPAGSKPDGPTRRRRARS